LCLSPRRGLPFYGPGTCSSRLRTRPLLAGDFVYEPDCRSRDGLVGEFGPKQGACFSLDRKLVGVGTSKICASVRRCVTVTRASCRTSWLWHRRAQRRQTERERLLRERQRRLGELSSIRTQHLVVESSHYPCFLTRKICFKKKKVISKSSSHLRVFNGRRGRRLESYTSSFVASIQIHTRTEQPRLN